MKALVVGGTGPTGPYIVNGLLERGYQVIILHTGAHEVELPPEVEHIHADPHFVDTLEAGLGKRSFDLGVCTYGRLRLVAQVMKGRVPRFISVGGGPVYKAWKDNVAPENDPFLVPEAAPLLDDPQADKLFYKSVEAEQEVMKAHREGHYRATHFRYPNVYGPRQLVPLEWCVMRRALDGRKKLILPNAGMHVQARGYAENMAHALLLAVDKPKESSGQVYNARDERLLTARTWISLICGAMNYRFDFVDMPHSLSSLACNYGGRTQHRATDISKIKDELGYRDVVPAEKGVELTVKWHLDNRPDAEIEQRLRDLGDPFDYDKEDKIIAAFEEADERIRRMVPPRAEFRHPYAHPKKAGA